MGIPEFLNENLRFRIPWLIVFVAMPCLGIFPPACDAQESQLPAGFERVSGRYVDITTDMPLSDELRELPAVFDAAMAQWCQAFDMPIDEVDDWHANVFIMLDRNRFHQAGFIPSHIPNFVYGFQYKDLLWVTEQPSGYYRRHLMLHEGTHWFMSRKFGRNGPPWLMEGMAEWLGTHRWENSRLQMGIIPSANTEVPYWGRLTLIQKQLADGTAPSLEDILRYSNTAHQQVDAYAWSWAAVVFLQNHPEASDAFRRMFSQPMRDDATLTRWLFGELRQQWPRLRSDWRAFVTDLEYGFDPKRGLLQLGEQTPVLGKETAQCVIKADQSWQSCGVRVEGPARLQISAEGRFSVGNQPAPWICEPQGVTLEYYRGQPLGKVMLAVVSPATKESEFTRPIQPIPIGKGGTVDIEEPGELFSRVNEPSGQLADNEGTFNVEVSR